MQRHDTDWFSLIAGVISLGSGAGYLLGRVSGAHADAEHVVPILLMVVGLLGLAKAVSVVRRSNAES